MRLIDLVSGPWALMPEQLVELQNIYVTHLRGDKIDIGAIESRLGRKLDNTQPAGYEVVNGVALVQLQGVMAPKANLFSQISGGASCAIARAAMLDAAADPAVQAGVLVADTPGGSVFGVSEFADAMAAFAAAKPLATWSDGQLCSAGYWAGSAAHSVFISGPAVQVGSIGVRMRHINKQRALAAEGLEVTDIVSGKYKGRGSDARPLSAEDLADYQAQSDYMYSLFVDAVAKNRGVPVKQVLANMADGRVFIGQQAIDAGLVDGVSTLEALVEAMATNPAQVVGAKPRRRQVAMQAPGVARSAGDAQHQAHTPTTQTTERPTMPEQGTETTPAATAATTAAPSAATQTAGLDRAGFEAAHPGLFATLRAEFTAQGATQERDRMQAVRAQLLPGHEALIERLATDGKTTGPEAAVQVLAAERAAQQGAAADHTADAPAALPHSNAPAGPVATTKADQVAQAQAYAKEHGCDFVAAVKALGFAQ
jgi:signal peptide peptidase SppA